MIVFNGHDTVEPGKRYFRDPITGDIWPEEKWKEQYDEFKATGQLDAWWGRKLEEYPEDKFWYINLEILNPARLTVNKSGHFEYRNEMSNTEEETNE
jgi:hypothetical protein